MIKAILFDMDGVLIDAKDWHYLALNKALKLFGLEIERQDHLETFDGIPTREKLKILSKRHGLPTELHSFLNKLKQQYTVDYCNIYCRPNFCNEYALSRLKNEGYKIAVCSNSIRKTIELFMKKSHLFPYVDLIVSNQDVEKGKPAPDMYLKAMREFGIEGNEALICEDNENGIKAAIASGGHLLKIKDIHDTNYINIKKRIYEIEKRIL